MPQLPTPTLLHLCRLGLAASLRADPQAWTHQLLSLPEEDLVPFLASLPPLHLQSLHKDFLCWKGSSGSSSPPWKRSYNEMLTSDVEYLQQKAHLNLAWKAQFSARCLNEVAAQVCVDPLGFSLKIEAKRIGDIIVTGKCPYNSQIGGTSENGPRITAMRIYLTVNLSRPEYDGRHDLLHPFDAILQQIDLSENPIGDVGLRGLLGCLDTIALSELNVSACLLSSKGASMLFDKLLMLNHKLKFLSVAHNNLGGSVTKLLAEIMSKGLVQRLDVEDYCSWFPWLPSVSRSFDTNSELNSL